MAIVISVWCFRQASQALLRATDEWRSLFEIAFLKMCGETNYREVISNLWAVTLLYGLYVALFGGSAYVLVYQRRNQFLMCSLVTMFLLTTAYIGLGLASTLSGPVVVSRSYVTPDGSEVLSCDPETAERLREVLLGDVLSLAQYGLSTCIGVAADIVLIYRCVVLWPQQRWIAFPLGLLLITSTALSFAAICLQNEAYLIAKAAPLDASPPPRWFYLIMTVENLMNSTNPLNLTIDTVATALIACRIWYMARQLERTLGKMAGIRYRAAVSMFVESGLLMLLCEILTTCTSFFITATYSGIISDITLMLVAIAPTLIIVRVGMHKGFDSVVETAHQHSASQSRGHTQTRTIQFAARRTTTTNVSDPASIGAVNQATARESDSDSDGAESADGSSRGSGQAEGTKTEKTEKMELDLGIV
ncbi:hypothetical protein DENSPDRAFT_931459 [Dentipellis sp. KUC8613]|nr:hypothetical protein DENSPDRAFT_931459 [Dentipellis sp. KUC8613]